MDPQQSLQDLAQATERLCLTFARELQQLIFSVASYHCRKEQPAICAPAEPVEGMRLTSVLCTPQAV